MFDPYRDWLGITDERRPPTLYQLLGIAPAEADPRTVEAAVSRQLAKVQKHLTSSKSKEAWQVVDEITLAKTTLLDPAKRAAYDGIFGFGKARPAAQRQPAAPAPMAAGAGWGQPAPPSAPPAWAPPPPAPPPAVQQPAAFVRAPLQQPAAVNRPPLQQPAPAPVAQAFNPLEDHDPPSDDSLPGATSIRRSVPRGGPSPLLLVGGGVIALGLVGGIIFLATQGGSKPSDGETKRDQVADNSGEQKQQSLPKIKHDVPKDHAKKTGPKKTKEPKAIPIVRKDPDPVPRPSDEDFKQTKVFRGHSGTPRALAVSPDGRQLLSGGADNAVNSWGTHTDKPSLRKALGEAPVGVAYLNADEAVAAGPGALYVLDLKTNKDKKKLMPPQGSFTALAAGTDGRHFMTGASQGQVCWWDAGKDEPERKILAGDGVAVDCLALTPDGKYVAAGDRTDGKVSVWNIAAGAQVKQWKAHRTDVTAMACSPDGKRLVTTGDDKLGVVWDLLSGAALFTLKGHEDVPLAAAWSADGTMIFTAGVDGAIRAWDAVTGAPLRWSFKSEFKVFALALDPKNRFLIAGLNDFSLHMLFLPHVRPDSLPKAVTDTVKLPPAPLLPPAPVEVESAVKTIRDRYQGDYAQSDPEEQSALYDKLMARATLAPEEPAVRFALFQEARDLAGRLGHMADSFKAIDARARWFNADELEDKAQALRAAGQGMVGKNVVEAAVALVEDAEKQARPDIVQELLLQNELFPQSDDAPQLAARIQAAKKRWMGATADRAASRKLAVDLKMDPDNLALNAQYGKYLCFRAGDWAEGLPKLAKGDDVALKGLAGKESADPKDAPAQLDLGKAWADYAATAEEPFKPGILVRAKFWYKKALDILPAKEKLAIGARTVEIDKQLTALGPVNLARPGEPVLRKSFNTIRSNAALESQWVVAGSDGYTPDGIVLKADASLSSRFKLLDRGRIEFSFFPDGRPIKLSACGEEVGFKPAAGSSLLLLSVERKANDLVFSLKSSTGAPVEEKPVKLTPAKQAPTPVFFSAPGPAAGDGIRITKILVNGPVKPME